MLYQSLRSPSRLFVTLVSCDLRAPLMVLSSRWQARAALIAGLACEEIDEVIEG